MEDRYNVECCDFIHAHEGIVEQVRETLPGEDTLSNRRMGDTVWGEARVIHRGRSTSLIHVDIRDAEGVILATGDFSYFCVDQKVGENPDIKEWKK